MKKLAMVVSTSFVILSGTANALPYVGAKLGYSWLNDECTTGYTCDDDNSASLGIFGGYELNKYLALEAGYDYLGKFTGAGLPDDSVYAFTLAPKVNYALNDAVSLYGKLGGAYVHYGNKNDESFLGALGVEFNVIDRGSVRVEYQKLTDINNDIVRASANTAYVGFSYRFGGNEGQQPAAVVQEKVKEKPAQEVPAKPVQMKTFKTTLLSNNTFESNSSQLKPESLGQLNELVSLLNKYPQAKADIIGYTDSSGAERYNQILSEKRAQAVATALTERGINASRLTVIGKGESDPVASNATPEGRAKNRRVEISVPEFEYQE
ncbi:OmpA family protein [Vibrio sp. S4M6]|uniref:OmpA family protein n=1 Tax=Vibrio sinus TaxID=2946865 RepID=UPI00202A64CD|nr:OmpA family protein [Vibrio sinus]MCL9780645.1 OmpA family protein [Vibrio sinus]